MSFMEASMDAYTMLGFCYEHGYGVEKNLQTAIDYYSLGGLYLEPEVIQNYDFLELKVYFRSATILNCIKAVVILVRDMEYMTL